MKEHPILFSGPLVRAILSGEKTQTRRLVRPPRGEGWRPVGKMIRTKADLSDPAFRWDRAGAFGATQWVEDRCPFGQPGDRLWVRETWQIVTGAKAGDLGAVVRYRDMELLPVTMPAEKPMPLGLTWDHWRPSIHMPRWASRLSLEVTEVRVQRIQDITEEDARAEGVHEHPLGRAALDARGTHKGAFLAVWEAINGARPGGSIAANPWVWAVSFKRVQG